MKNADDVNGRVDAETLYRAHAPFVASFLNRLGARQSEMEDLLQEVFLVAHRAGGYTPGPAKATTWLAEIAVRLFANVRRKRRTELDEPLETLEAKTASPEEAAINADALARVNECLQTLDPNHRATFLLFELYGESAAEIAAAMNVPVGTIHSRLHNARKRFMAAWNRKSSSVETRL